MALAKKNGLLGGMVDTFRNCAAAVGLATLAACGADANSADNQQYSDNQSVVMTEELKQLDAADRAATAYASKHGVAILLHVGLDIQNHPRSEELLQQVEEKFCEKFAAHGLDVEVFPSMNDGQATVLTYHVGEHIYSPPGADPILGLQEASNLVADVAEQARIAIQMAAVQQEEFTPSNPG